MNQTNTSPRMARLQQRCQELYHGDSNTAYRFRLGLLVFDFLTVLFFILSSMMEPSMAIYMVDYIIAGLLLMDFGARRLLETDTRRWLMQFDTWLDLAVIGSLLASMLTDNFSFLRIIRTLRLLRSYRMLRDLRARYTWFNAHQDVITSTFNLFVFIFFITACVYVMEHGNNPGINNYLDALYYTITTLTTTGFGDIVLKDTSGRMLSVVIMVVGVSLFLRLVQTIFQPAKVRYRCPDCGLLRHDHDAVHCKHCGRVLDIESQGF